MKYDTEMCDKNFKRVKSTLSLFQIEEKKEQERTNELTLLREEHEGMNRLRLNLIRDKNKLWE